MTPEQELYIYKQLTEHFNGGFTISSHDGRVIVLIDDEKVRVYLDGEMKETKIFTRNYTSISGYITDMKFNGVPLAEIEQENE